MKMTKKITFLFAFLFILIGSVRADQLSGFWQTIDKKTRQPSSIIAVYTYQGKYYGRIVATCDQQGRVVETVDQPKTRAPGVPGNPYYCGIDIIWACTPDRSGICKGHVIDPREGKRYNAKIWNEHGNLILRGELLMFGRNEILTRCPQGKFKEPDPSTFVPKSCNL